MRNIKRQGVLLGAGLLSVGAIVGFSEPASAQGRHGRGNRGDVREERKDVKEARKEVRRERRDVKHADTRAERREEREDMRDAREDLRRERQDLRHERQDSRPRGNNGYRDDYRNNNDWRYRQNRSNDNYGGYRYGGGTRNGTPYYNEDIHGDLRTLEGTVTNDLRGNNFTMRLTNGQFLRVNSQIGEPVQLSQGDYVRVFGFSSNGVFYARGLRVLSNR